MKSLLHCAKPDFIKLLKSCFILVNLDTLITDKSSDLIYLGCYLYKREPIIIYSFDEINDNVSVVLRRQFFLYVCCIDNCKCKGFKCKIDDVLGILTNRMYKLSEGYIIKSGFSRLIKGQEYIAGDLRNYISSVIYRSLILIKAEIVNIFCLSRNDIEEYKFEIDGCKINWYHNKVECDPNTMIPYLNNSDEFYTVYNREKFTDSPDVINISLFECCSEVNLSKYKTLFKNRISTNDRIMLVLFSAESFGYINGVNIDSRRPRFKRFNHNVFGTYNMEPFKANIDLIPFKDLEVLSTCNGTGNMITSFSDITSDSIYEIAVVTNLFNTSVQTVVNSPTMLIKSVSSMIQFKFFLTNDDLHKLRFELLKSSLPDVELFYHIDGMWSLAYYWRIKDGKRVPVYVDTSGHVINSLIFSSIYGFNWALNWRERVRNVDLAKKLKPYLFYNVIDDNLRNFVNGEDRQMGDSVSVWHTSKEDIRGCDVAAYMIREMHFPMVDIKYIKSRLLEFNTRGLISVPVVHDKKEINIKDLPGWKHDK